MNILICEDNPVIAMDLGWMLQDLGHRVCGTASTSVRGMEQCALKHPDLVVVDLNLADGRTGLGLIEALTQLHIPSIIVSGETDRLGAATSAKAILSKPLDEARLAQAMAAVEWALGGRPVVGAATEPLEATQPEAGPDRDAPPRRPWLRWLWRQGA